MWKFAFRNLLNRPIRSLLALLWLTVAIAGMVGLFSVAEGLDNMVDNTFDQIPGLVVMQPGAPIPLFSRIPSKWEVEISEIKGVGIVNFEVWSRVNLINGKGIVSPPRFLFGTDIQRTFFKLNLLTWWTNTLKENAMLGMANYYAKQKNLKFICG